MTAAAPPLADRWIFGGLLVLLLWLPLPWGSKPPEASAVLGLLAGLLVAARLGVASQAPLPRLPAAARLALALWVIWSLWLACQLLPLPETLLARLSPVAHARHAALGEAALFTISILPGAGVDRLLQSLAYFALFWLTLVSLARNRGRQRLLLWVVVIAGLAQALYGILMTLSGVEYGFFEPKRYGLGIATGTFVNRNHFAGYMELTLSAGIALILADLRPKTVHGWRQRLAAWVDLLMSSRVRIRIMLVVMVIGLVLTRSRMGNIAFFVSLSVCGCIYVFLRHRQLFWRSLALFISLIAVDLLIVSERFGLERLAQRLQQTDLETEQRLQIFADSRALVHDYWLTGAGLGSFAAAYSPYRSDHIARHVDHAHNDHLQFLAETGIIGYGILALLAATVLLNGFRVVMRRQDPTACALGFVGPMAMTTLLVHGLGDFNLQIPANAALLVVLMAASLSCSARSHRLRTADVPETAAGGR